MIVTKYYETRQDGVNLYRTYSDADMRIRQDQTGAIYDEAIDVEGIGYTYTETNEPVDDEDPSAQEQLQAKAEAYDILLGVIG